ncbi:hypothetical protein GOV11_01420 [Candidatus Woesearchaeota archaeon]|nr:hypothetical protein [Candidatus Woesearchaeota archaeon]
MDSIEDVMGWDSDNDLPESWKEPIMILYEVLAAGKGDAYAMKKYMENDSEKRRALYRCTPALLDELNANIPEDAEQRVFFKNGHQWVFLPNASEELTEHMGTYINSKQGRNHTFGDT